MPWLRRYRSQRGQVGKQTFDRLPNQARAPQVAEDIVDHFRNGLDGLADEPRPGAPRKVTADLAAQVVARTIQEKPANSPNAEHQVPEQQSEEHTQRRTQRRTQRDPVRDDVAGIRTFAMRWIHRISHENQCLSRMQLSGRPVWPWPYRTNLASPVSQPPA